MAITLAYGKLLDPGVSVLTESVSGSTSQNWLPGLIETQVSTIWFTGKPIHSDYNKVSAKKVFKCDFH